MAMPDLQGVWETAVREVALEGSNGCTLERLWKLVQLHRPSQQGGSGSTPQQPGEEQPDDDGSDPREFVKAWLWRSIVSRRGRELFLATYNDQGESNNLKRGDPEDSRLAAIKDIPTLEQEQRSVGVVASRPVRLRALGLDTATLKSVTLVSPAYLQVLEASTGLIFKSVVQKPATGNEEDGEQKDGMFRFVVLYLKRFKDSILVPPGTKLEPTAKEVFLEMLVEHLLEAGGSGGIVPWYNIRKDLFLDKNASGRLRNFLKKENKIPNFPIRIQLLDIRAMDYVNSRKGRRLEWCVSLKHSSELEPPALKRPYGISLARSIMGIVKSRGEDGANVEAMQQQLHCSKRPAVKIVDLLVKNPSAYGIWKGYTREGRNAKVQALFYDEELLGRGNTKRPAATITTSAPAIKTDIPTPSKASPTQGAATPVTATTVTSQATPAGGGGGGGGGSGGSGIGGSGSADGAGAGGGAAGGAAGAGLGDVNWSDDDELDAMVDDIGREVDEAAAAAAAKSLDKIVVDRLKFEMNPMYPPEGCSMAERLAWLQMTPKDRRKSFVLHELGLCKSIPVLKVIQLIKLLEGPGPMLQKATLDTVVAELVQEGRIKTAIAPQPKRWAWRGRMKTFGHGEMILLPDAKTDPESLAEYAENFYAVEAAGERYGAQYSWDGVKSPERFLIHKRKMQRTMILHRELLRCLTRLPGQRVGSRALDLDRVILDMQLSTFITMFGCPPNYLHSKEMYKVLKKAEAKKATIRQAPRAIWEIMRTVPWYKEALMSTLQILHDMRILTKMDSPAAPSSSSSSSASGGVTTTTAPSSGSADNNRSTEEGAPPSSLPGEDPFAYRHATAQVVPISTDETTGKAVAVSGGGDGSAAIDKFHKAVEAARVARQDALQYSRTPGARDTTRGISRDKKARSAAAEALLRENSPPKEFRMGLGWAVLHVDVVIYTEDKNMAQPRRVPGHMQWSNFWNTYQVPYLTNPKEWGVDDDEPEEEEEDMALILAVKNYLPKPTYPNTKPSGPGRDGYSSSMRQAVQPVADMVGKSAEACWRRYRNIANEQAKYAAHGEALPLPANMRTRNKKRPHDNEDDGGDGNDADQAKSGSGKKENKRKGRRTGLLAIQGPLMMAKKAREEAALAKAAGFEWVNEENSWEEDGCAGGVLPRPFDKWAWTTEELEALVAVRQLLLVSAARFNPKAYRSLMASRQIDIAQAAWAANDYSVQDSVDHEVYKMVGRHGKGMVSRGIVAAGRLHALGIAGDNTEHEWSSPLPTFESRTPSNNIIDNPMWLPLKLLCRFVSLSLPASPYLDAKIQPRLPPARSPPRPDDYTAPQPPAARPASLAVKDIGGNRTMVSNLLESVVSGRASFAVGIPASRPTTLELGVSIDGMGMGDGVRDVGGGSGSGSGSGGGGGSGSATDAAAGAAVPPATSLGKTASDAAAPAAGTPPQSSSGAAVAAVAAAAAAPPRPGAETAVVGGHPAKPGDGNEAAQGTVVAGPAAGGNKKDSGASGLQESVATATRYRSARCIDADIMATVDAEVRPRDDGGVSAEPWPAHAMEGGSGRDVFPPEMGWGSTATSEGAAPAEDDGVATSAVVEALKKAGKEGMTLSQLWGAARRAKTVTVRSTAATTGESERQQQWRRLRGVIGCVLRSSGVLCVCGAGDVRYVHEDSCGLLAIPPGPTAESGSFGTSSAPVTAPATPMEVEADSMDEEEASDSATRKGWKGKGKGKKSSEPAAAAAAPSSPGLALKDGVKRKVLFPWTTFDGEVDLRFLNRVRQGLVAYVRSNPGCLAAGIREAELSFLTIGETMLLLRDLVRRKVLRDHFVPDTTAVALAGGWGLSQQQQSSAWAAGSERASEQHVRMAATTSFSTALGWQGMMARIEGMAETTACQLMPCR
ncbi:unnamed protein product [Ectocarpus sp. CCAP 1310/34]|nr:unnamed protein product [Ectocarpus sp. CCAP 1310/34]